MALEVTSEGSLLEVEDTVTATLDNSKIHLVNFCDPFLPAVCEYYKCAGQKVLQDAACDGVGKSQSVVSQFIPILKIDFSIKFKLCSIYIKNNQKMS